MNAILKNIHYNSVFRNIINNFKLELICCNQIYLTNVDNLFWENDKKGGYNRQNKKIPKLVLIKNGLKELKDELALWKNEVKEKFSLDPVMICRPGETDVLWRYGNKESLLQWVTTSDSDHNEGKSTCSLNLSRHGRGVFSGVINTEVPKDGKTKKAGYCNMRSIRARKSFKREAYLDWHMYNKLVLKIRGDGRPYLLNIASEGYYDIWWNDVYHYILYTRGGPYWQIAKIPFSKFFLSSKGRVQDRQYPLRLDRITSFGISAGDRVNGPFQLEIDYIGLEYDPNHTEEFAYEMYKVKQRYIVAN